MARFKLGKKNKRDDASITSNNTMPLVMTDDFAYKTNGRLLGHGFQPVHEQALIADSVPPSVISDLHPNNSKFGHTARNYTSSGPKQLPDDVTTPWKRFKLVNSPFPRYRHAALSVTSDKNEVFLMGGLKEGSVFGDTWKIVPTTTHHQITGYDAMPIEVALVQTPPARVGHALVLCGNAFIVYGGDTVDTDENGFPDNNFYLFNINNNKYTVPSHILDKPNGRYGHTLAVVSLTNLLSRLYLFGGQLENLVYDDLYYFELNTFKLSKARWELVEPANAYKPPPLTNHLMLVYKNKLYVFGGVYNNEKVSNDVWCFDPAANKWTQVPTTGNVPPPTNEHSACVVGDKLFVYGGNDFSGIIYLLMYVLDLTNFSWQKVLADGEVAGPGPRCGHLMTFIPRYHKLVIMGGDKNDYVKDDPNDFDVYDNFTGNEIGTMVFELDVDYVEHFLTLTPDAAAATAAPKKMAALAKPEYQPGHSRLYSAGPDDFASAEALPMVNPVASPSQVPPLDEPKRKSLDPKEQDGFGSGAAAGAAAGAGAVGAAGILGAGAAGAGFGHDEVAADPVSPEQVRGQEPRDTDQFRSLPRELGNGHRELASPPAMGISRDLHDLPLKVPEVPEDEPFGANNALSRSMTNDGGKLKALVAELLAQLNYLRGNAKIQMQQATERIAALEEENRGLRDSANTAPAPVSREVAGEPHPEVAGLQRQLAERDEVIAELKRLAAPDAGQSEVTALGRAKLERVELQKQMSAVQQENQRLQQQLAEYEPFMNNQVTELQNFHNIIAMQEQKIAQLQDAANAHHDTARELAEWKNKHAALDQDYAHFRTLHDDVVDGDTTKRDIAGSMQALIDTWKTRLEEIKLRAPEPVANDAQRQLDELLVVQKENDDAAAREIADLRALADERQAAAAAIEAKYRDALLLVNNTSKALKLTQEEVSSQKLMLDKLMKENNELTMFKKASKRTSSRAATPSGTPHTNDAHFDTIAEDLDEEVTLNAHYNMKIKDLEADLYILKQERDLLKDNVTLLQKQLYLAQAE